MPKSTTAPTTAPTTRPARKHDCRGFVLNGEQACIFIDAFRDWLLYEMGLLDDCRARKIGLAGRFRLRPVTPGGMNATCQEIVRIALTNTPRFYQVPIMRSRAIKTVVVKPTTCCKEARRGSLLQTAKRRYFKHNPVDRTRPRGRISLRNDFIVP